MKLPNTKELRLLNAVVNNPEARILSATMVMRCLGDFLSAPDEHFQQMLAAMRHDEVINGRQHGKMLVALWAAITEALPAFRAAILKGCKDAGIPNSELPKWL